MGWVVRVLPEATASRVPSGLFTDLWALSQEDKRTLTLLVAFRLSSEPPNFRWPDPRVSPGRGMGGKGQIGPVEMSQATCHSWPERQGCFSRIPGVKSVGGSSGRVQVACGKFGGASMLWPLLIRCGKGER